MDFALYHAINGRGPEFVRVLFRFFAVELTFVIVGLVVVLFLLVSGTKSIARRRAAVFASLAGGLAVLLAQPLSELIDRPRPFVAHPGHAHLLVAHSSDPSFPSDHATGTFAIATAIWLYDRTLGWIFFALAMIVGVARVYVGAHYPSDVLAGALLGIAVSTLLSRGGIRRAIEHVADLCGRLWDAIVAQCKQRLAL